jgi:hypothetical protein
MIYDYIVKSFEYQSRKSVDGIEEGYGFKFLHYTKAYISSKLDMRYKQKMLKDFAKIFVKDFLGNKLQTKYGVIYCVEDSEGKKYIGQCLCFTKKSRVYNLIDRWNLHVTKAFGKTKGGSTLLHDAIKKNGIKNFKIYQITRCKSEHLDMLEKYYMNDLNTIYPNGYNLLSEKGHNELTKQKMSEAQKGVPKNYIKPDKKTYDGTFLPPGIEYYNDGKGNVGYRVHKKKGISIKSTNNGRKIRSCKKMFNR